MLIGELVVQSLLVWRGRTVALGPTLDTVYFPWKLALRGKRGFQVLPEEWNRSFVLCVQQGWAELQVVN